MNTNKPGLPDYTGPNEGWALWVHHEEMSEYCTDFKGRIDYIRCEKPAGEISIRLKALTYLTPDEIPTALDTARTALDTARMALDTARTACDPAWVAYDTAWEALAAAWVAYDTAYAEAIPLLRPLCEQHCAGLYRDEALLFTKEGQP